MFVITVGGCVIGPISSIRQAEKLLIHAGFQRLFDNQSSTYYMEVGGGMLHAEITKLLSPRKLPSAGA